MSQVSCKWSRRCRRQTSDLATIAWPAAAHERLLGWGHGSLLFLLDKENPLNADALKPSTGRVPIAILILEPQGRSGQLCW